MNVYEVITTRIIELMQKGTVPWRQPWRGGNASPKNLVSGKPYRGINVLMLGCQGYTSPYWLTYNQAKDRGGNVKKGEKGTPVVFYKTYEDKDENNRFVLRYFTAFNADQCEGIETPKPERAKTPHERIEACEAIVKGYRGPTIQTGGRACYQPLTDTVTVPAIDAFDRREEYYSTLFHELAHSTGAKHRLDREGITSGIVFGSHNYSYEELIAECGAAFLCGATGIDAATVDNSAAYLASWIKKLKSEPQWIVKASSAAAKAADLIRGVKAERKDVDEAAE
jgi:antirestriction protein ArdC